jgi:hypothetical protein
MHGPPLQVLVLPYAVSTHAHQQRDSNAFQFSSATCDLYLCVVLVGVEQGQDILVSTKLSWTVVTTTNALFELAS